MLKSLLHHQRVVRAAVLSDEYVGAAQKAKRTAPRVEALEDDGLDDELGELADLDSGMAGAAGGKKELVGTGKYNAVYNDINDPAFWNVLKEYININTIVCGYIHDLGSPSATLSDAARALLLIDHHVRSITTTKYPALFGGNVSQFAVPLLQNLWAERLRAALTDNHVLALLLDMRPSTRSFIAENKLLGSGAGKDHGNTPMLERARRSLIHLAPLCVPDELLPVSLPSDKRIPMKQHILRQQFDVFLEVHPQHIPWATLQIDRALLDQVSDADAPLCFWQVDAPPNLPLRSVGIRTAGAKPSGSGMERIWNFFGQVFTPTRRSLRSSRVSQLVYVKANMHLLSDSATLEAQGLAQLTDPAQFTSVFEEASRLDDEDFVRTLLAVGSPVEVVEDDVDEDVPAEPVVEEEHDWTAGFL